MMACSQLGFREFVKCSGCNVCKHKQNKQSGREFMFRVKEEDTEGFHCIFLGLLINRGEKGG